MYNIGRLCRKVTS